MKSLRPGLFFALLLALWLLRLAVMAHAGAGLHVDEAQYWWWSQSLQWGYYSKPPLIAALIAASTSLFGDGLLGVKALPMACWVLATAVVHALGRELGGAAAAWWAAGIFAASPLAGLLGLTATTDAPLMLCWALALWAAWRAVVRRQQAAWWALAAALGLGLLGKYTMAALLPGLALFVWLHGRKGDLWRLAAALAGAALVFAPHLLWNAEWGWPTLAHTIESTDSHTGQGQAPLARVAWLLLAQAGIFGPAAAALVLLLGLRAWRCGRSFGQPQRDLLLAGTALLLAAGVLQGLRGRVEVNWLAPLHLGLAVAGGLLAASLQGGAARRWAAALAAQAGLFTALGLLPAAIAAWQPGAFAPAALDLWARMRGWDTTLAALEPQARAHHGAVLLGSSRQALAHGLYAWRQLALRPAAFNPDGAVRDHFALICPWAAAARLPGPFLLLTEGPPPPEWQAAFVSITTLGTAAAARSPRRHVALVLSLAKGPKPPPASLPPPHPGACP